MEPPSQTRPIDADLISRNEVVALLFKVSDIAETLERIAKLLEDDDGEEETDGE
jgi:hypothetical protein